VDDVDTRVCSSGYHKHHIGGTMAGMFSFGDRSDRLSDADPKLNYRQYSSVLGYGCSQ